MKIPRDIPVAAAATGGKGLALQPQATLPDPVLRSVPGHPIDYVEFTSSVTVSGTAEDTPSTVVTGTSNLNFDGTDVWVEFFACRVAPGSSDKIEVFLYLDSASQGVYGLVTAAGQVPVLLRRKLTPGKGVHTLSVGAIKTTTDGTVVAGAGGAGKDVPGYLLVTKA